MSKTDVPKCKLPFEMKISIDGCEMDLTWQEFQIIFWAVRHSMKQSVDLDSETENCNSGTLYDQFRPILVKAGVLT